MGKVLIGTIVPPGSSGEESATEVAAALAAHIISPTPHPAYDDDMNLDIYFENGMA